MRKLSIDRLIDYLKTQHLLVEHDAPGGMIAHKPETDSRQVEQNDLFICIKGFSTDGHRYAPKAVAMGASILIVEERQELNIPQIVVYNARKAAALAAKIYFEDPTRQFHLIGATGTNGKTTITHLIRGLLDYAGYKTGLIGTLGYYIGSDYYPSERTTPDIMELNRIFADMVEEGVQCVVMEVSSHAIALDRIYGLNFDLAVFSNLTRDHLDFHETIDNYKRAKFTLFDYLTENDGVAIVNIDDQYGKELFDILECERRSVSFEHGSYMIDKTSSSILGCEFELHFNQRSEPYSINFIGKHNVLNTALAIAAIKESYDITLHTLQEALANIQHVEGRLEPIEPGSSIYIDYAHTPDALEHVLQSLKEIPHRRLICVFGAGGDRDRGKRPEMGRIAVQYADVAIVTSDNPRHESPESIIKGITREIDQDAPIWILRDRKMAIEAAIRLAGKDDIVLIAGKGHEKYQQIGDKKHDFDDAAIARQIQVELAARDAAGDISTIELDIPIDSMMLERIFGVEIAGENYFRYISTDTRTIRPESLYFAIKGERFDGHSFVFDALEEERCMAVVSRAFPDDRTIVVKDTTDAYQKLAKAYARIFPATRIGLTGSVGKTTTKAMLTGILSEVGKVHFTHANENNQIGVPKTLFKLRTWHDYAVVELGTNHPGEMKHIARILAPEIGLITSIGPSHLEFFGDEKGVAREKAELLNFTTDKKIIPSDFVLKDYRKESVTFGNRGDYELSNIEPDASGVTFEIKGQSYRIATPVPYLAENALAAVAVCGELGIDAESIRNGLRKPLEIGMRTNIFTSGDRIVIADCYNANPTSMIAAIRFWKDFEPNRFHVAFLGDMLELGESSEKYHKAVGKELKGPGMRIFSIGKDSIHYGAGRHFDNVKALLESDALDDLPKNAVILIKASHGIHLEKLTGRL